MGAGLERTLGRGLAAFVPAGARLFETRAGLQRETRKKLPRLKAPPAFALQSQHPQSLHTAADEDAGAGGFQYLTGFS